MESVKVRIPATSANLGPGFDCLGMAFNLYNRLEVHEDERLRIELEGDGSGFIPQDGSNLTYQAMKRAYEAAGRRCPNFFIRQTNAVPLSRGLGSSSAAIVGGLVAANAMMGNPLDKTELARIATQMEGHPDNVVPCIFGGLTAAVCDGTALHFARTMPSAKFAYAAMVPDFFLPTKKARQVLPEEYPRADAVFNVGRAVLMYAALEQGLCESIKAACQDRLHQPYRRELVPGWNDVVNHAVDSGALGVFLSGAGPTILAIYDRGDEGFARRVEAGLGGLEHRWKVLRLECSEEGAVAKRG